MSWKLKGNGKMKFLGFALLFIMHILDSNSDDEYY